MHNETYEEVMKNHIEKEEWAEVKQLFIDAITATTEGFEEMSGKTIAVGIFFDPEEWPTEEEHKSDLIGHA